MMILTILYKLDGCVKPSNIDIQLSNNSPVPSTITDCACCNTKDREFICSEIYIYILKRKGLLSSFHPYQCSIYTFSALLIITSI